MYYNPCSPVTSPDCGDQSVCSRDANKIIGYGSANSSTFVTGKDGLSLKYTNDRKSSTVHLKCDQNARTEPFFRVQEITDDSAMMSVYSVCACDGSCYNPPL